MMVAGTGMSNLVTNSDVTGLRTVTQIDTSSSQVAMTGRNGLKSKNAVSVIPTDVCAAIRASRGSEV